MISYIFLQLFLIERGQTRPWVPVEGRTLRQAQDVLRLSDGIDAASEKC